MAKFIKNVNGVLTEEATVTTSTGMFDMGKVPSLNVSGVIDATMMPASVELVANKATDFSTVNNTLYPSVQAVKTYADGLVVGLLDDRGSYDASVNTYPAAGGSGSAGAVLKGDLWYISVAGTLGGTAVSVGDSVRALADAPGQTAANWSVLESNIGFVPANVAGTLGQFAATTSAQLAGVISDETGSGALVFATSPTLVTPVLGTPTSVTLTNADGTAANLTAGQATAALGLKTSTTTVSVSGAAAPSAGQVLQATSDTAAQWVTPVQGNSTSVTTSEILAAGDFVNIWNSSGAKARKADATTDKRAHGYVLAGVASGGTATVYFDGTNNQVTGQTPGTVFLTTTPGIAGASAPSGTGNIVQALGVATSATSINFEASAPIVLA